MNTNPDRDDSVTLNILDTVEQNEHISQRDLSRKLGVALGLANSYLKRCVRKGLIKVQQAPANRYLYYLTPKGFSEKSRLTAQYLSYSLSFYREAGNSCSRLLDQCERNRWHRLLLCGVSDLAEIATLRTLERKLAIVGFFDPSSDRDTYLGFQVWKRLDCAAPHDVRIVTAIVEPDQYRVVIMRDVAQLPLLIPDVLRLKSDQY